LVLYQKVDCDLELVVYNNLLFFVALQYVDLRQDLLYALFKAHPDWEYTCIVRNAEKGAKIAASYPKVRLVYGTLDSVDLLEEEAGRADIIYRNILPP
jgi:hypothetical protein